MVLLCLTHTLTHSAVILYVIGLILFPAGMDDPVIRTLCENTAAFQLGNCQLGWAYIIMIVGTAIAIVATILSWSTIKWREKDQDTHSFAV